MPMYWNSKFRVFDLLGGACIVGFLLLLPGSFLTLLAAEPAVAEEASATATATLPDWVEPMRKVHAAFDGNAGYVAQLGDSITHSLAFWSPLGWDEPQQYLTEEDGLPEKPENQRWRDVIQGTRDKGSEHGNQGGWRVGNVQRVLDEVLAKKKPEVALIMLGTNDISGKRVPKNYEPGLTEIVQKCLDAHCVPILSTIPPRRDHDAVVAEANDIVKKIAREKQIPLIDYHAEIVRRQPEGAWQGTLISADGVHPTGKKTNVYDEENLQVDGYALRNWLSFLKLREVYFWVLQPQD